ncbi:phosphonate ABC transporter permease [Actinomycetota bacterium]|nr:phosphonate ABC transporter permease [Actinomycetota bacterium]
MIDSIKQKLRSISIPQLVVLILLLAMFSLILIAPLVSLFSKAFETKSGEWAGLANYQKYFDSPSLSVSIWNTVDISIWSTIFAVAFGFMFAYALTRTRIKGKTFFKYIALIPIFIPTLVHALGLVYLFGNQGVITQLGFDIGLYGRTGIIISEIIYTFPQAFLMFLVALEYADGRLYEAADSMGVPPLRQFFKITLPDIKYTLINVFFVCFTLAFTDFGAPKVIGGSYNVLATDIYKQIAGQFNMNMGAVVGTLLLIPALLSFIVGRIVNNKNASTLSAKATKLNIKKSAGRDAVFFALCVVVTVAFLTIIAALFMGAFTTYYPYDMSFSLQSFKFDDSTGGIGSFYHSVEMSIFTAAFGTVFVFIYAYMMEKTRRFSLLKKIGKLLSVLPIALPGMVIGLSFIFFFNNQDNPLNFIYGTVIILVVSNILHYFSVPFITATGALKKLDGEFENVSESMNIPRWKTVLRVSAPLSMPAILEIFMYFFVNSMVTVSAVVFLYSAQFRIAAIAITHMEEAGNLGQAAAMSLLILLINVFVRILYEVAIKIIKARTARKETANV